KPILLTGPVLAFVPTDVQLDQKLVNWLDRQKEYSVRYCCLGSEFILEKRQFQEFLLGLEQSKFPFLAVLKVPPGTE
ncbi:hypothetical protein, partial [Escherichia coli]|uniref:hypothetical protein n=1 Tax=Escherichia coli TaxID=562 RepID=UPI003F4695A9